MGLVELFVQTLVTPLSTSESSGLSSMPIFNMPITYIILFGVGAGLWINNILHFRETKSKAFNS